MTFKSHKQGELDGLCGVYAIVNAMRHLIGVHDLDGEEGHDFTAVLRAIDDDIFKVVLEAIPKREYPGVLLAGMKVGRLFTTAKQAAKLMQAIGLDVTVERPFKDKAFKDVDAFFKAMDRIRNRDYAAIVIGLEWLEAGGGHWSVYRDRTARHLRLHDSTGEHQFALKSLTLTEGRPNRLCPNETLVFRLHGCDGVRF